MNGESMPLKFGLIVGLRYCVAGICIGFSARGVSGWRAGLLRLIAVLLTVAGAWTLVFTGGWLIFFKRATSQNQHAASE